MVATSFFKYMGYNTFSHFTIDVLILNCFATDVLTERSGSLSEPGSIFSHSDLNLLMEFLYFTVRKGLFRVSAINRFDFSI